MSRPDPPPPGRSLLVDAMLIVLATAVGRLLALGRGLVRSGFDLGTLFVPNLSWWWSRPRLGHGWNPWVFGGVPADADPELGQLHPAGLLYALAPPFTAACIEAALTPALAGIGLLLYLRRIGAARAGAIVGGLSFALGGFIAGHAVHPPLMRTAAAVPWVLLAVESLEGVALAAGFGAALALLVAGGHPQTVVYATAPLGVYVLCFGRLREGARRRALVAGAALAVAATAGMWLPSVVLIRESTRWALGPLDPMDTQSRATLHTMVVPFAYGGAVGPAYGRTFERFPGCGVIACMSYPGMVVWLLVLAGLPVVLRSSRGRFWAAVAVFAVAFAGGAFDAVLGLRGVRGPSRMLLWWSVAAATLAGLAWPSAGTSRSGRWVVPALLAGVIAWSSTTGPDAGRAAAVAAALLAVSAGAWWLGSRGGRRAAWLPVAVLFADLLLLTTSLPFDEPAVPVGQRHPELTAVRELLAAEPSESMRVGRTLVVPLSFDADWAPFAATPLLQGYNPLVPRRLSELLHGEARPEDERGLVADPALVSARNRVLDVLRARLVVVATGDHPVLRAFEDAMRASPERWTRLDRRAGDFDVWRNRRAAPLAWCVPAVRVVPDDVALRLVRGLEPGDDFDPAREALAPAPIPGVEAGPPCPPVDVVAYGEDVVRLRAAPAAGALVVVGELAHPGWRAEVDGGSVPLYTVDAGVRGVVVPAGRHDVTLTYAPPLARTGLALTVAGVLGLGLCALRARRAPARPRR